VFAIKRVSIREHFVAVAWRLVVALSDHKNVYNIRLLAFQALENIRDITCSFAVLTVIKTLNFLGLLYAGEV